MSDEDDTRVLNMRINNKDFLKGTSDSLQALNTLNKGVDNAGKGKGLQNLGKSADVVKTRFSAMQIAGVTALATITNKAVNAGLNLVKSLTISPILGGFREYEKLLTSTQTIMANTGESTKVVGKYLNELNKYSDQTIYNFGQMADNIGRFTAAGVKLPDATSAIKGLANAAALSGSSTEQLNTAMYQMSQALSTGVIKLMDWNSLANAGLGGKNIRDSLMLTARTLGDHGKAMDSAIKKNGSFRESLSEGWLTADIFTKSMKVFAGQSKLAGKSVDELRKLGYDKLAISAIKAGKTVAYSVKQLKEMGYSDAAAKQLNKLSQASIDSATKIKTFSQLMDVVKESIESGWAGIFGQLFGNLEEAGNLWTTVGDKITTAVGTIFTSMISMLKVWHNMENDDGLNGYTMLWGAFGNIIKSVGNLLRPFFSLFTGLLPSTKAGGSALFSLTEAFYQFSVWLEKATRSLSFLNPVFSLLGEIVGAVFGAFLDLLGLFKPLGSSLIGLAGSLGDVTGKLGGLGAFKGGISSLFETFNQARLAVLEPFVVALTNIVDAFKAFLNGDIDPTQLGESIRAAFSNLGSDLFGLFDKGRAAAADLIAGLRNGVSGGGGDIKSSIQGFVDGFVDFFKGLLGIHSPSTVFEGFGRNIVEGLIAGLKGAVSLIGDAIGAIGDALGGIDKFDIANVISVMFGGAVFLTIRKFMNALSQSMSTFKGFADAVMGEKGLLGETTKTMRTMQTGIKAKAILNIAIAIGILAASLWLLSKIPADKLITGMAAITFMLYQLIGVMKVMSSNAATTKTAIASMTAMAIAMALMATAILILSAAVLAFGLMDTGTLVKGLIAVGVALAILSAAAYVLGAAAPTMILAAGGVLILSVALGALAPVILLYSKIDWGTILSGLAKMAVVLVALALAMIPLAAAGPMILVAAAALVVLSVGLGAMAGVITLFSGISWGTIISGVAKIATALVVLGVAALVAAPGLIALGVAAGLIGLGMLAAGAGMALFGAGLAVVAAAGTAAAAVLIAAFEGFLSILPLMAIQLVAALATFLGALAEKAPEIVTAVVEIGSELLRGLSELSPKIAETAVQILTDFIGAIVAGRVALFQAGFDLVTGFLDAILQNVPQMVQQGTDIIVAFITGIGAAAEQLVVAAGETILSFLNAVNMAVTIYMPQILHIGGEIARNLILGLVQGLIPEPILTAFTNFVGNIIGFFKGLLGINSPSTVFAGFGRNIVQGLASGISGLIGMATGAIGNLVSNVIGIARGLPGKAKAALSGLGGILKGVFSSAFTTAVSAVTSGVKNIGSAISKIPGLIRGALGAVGSAAKSVGSSIVNGIKNGLGSAVSAVGNLGSALVSGIKSAINSVLRLPLNIPRIHINLPGPKDINFGGQQVIPRFAKGVTGFSGGSALVGEVGPELVTMGRGANVITNKNLIGFMKQVAALTKALASDSFGQNSPGGNISYAVSADFKGDPKASGTQFAANIAAGLINGIKSNQESVNKSMSNMGSGASKSFADILGIKSPSTVFQRLASYVSQGFVNGLIASTDEVNSAAKNMAQGAVDTVSKTISDNQLRLEVISAEADAYEAASKNGRLSKSERSKLLAQSKTLRAQAEAQAAAVEKENAATDRAAAYAKADTQGKADMKNEDAVAAALEASRYRQLAEQNAKQASLIRKKDKAGAARLDDAASSYLAAATKSSEAAASLAAQSLILSNQAKTEVDGKPVPPAQTISPEEVRQAKAAFDAYNKSIMDAQLAAIRDDVPPSEFKFEQNNYSPEAISPAEAYRNGKNLVSIMERKLVPTPP